MVLRCAGLSASAGLSCYYSNTDKDVPPSTTPAVTEILKKTLKRSGIRTKLCAMYIFV